MYTCKPYMSTRYSHLLSARPITQPHYGRTNSHRILLTLCNVLVLLRRIKGNIYKKSEAGATRDRSLFTLPMLRGYDFVQKIWKRKGYRVRRED